MKRLEILKITIFRNTKVLRLTGSLGSRACMDWPRKKTMQGWKFVTQKKSVLIFQFTL